MSDGIVDGWNYDMEAGKKEGLVLIAVASRPANAPPTAPVGFVTTSRWIEKDGRWNFCNPTTKVIAWQPWPKYPAMARVRERPAKSTESQQ